MSALLLSALLQIASPGLSMAEAEARARHDEAALPTASAEALFAAQGKAMGKALINCGVEEAREASGLRVVMKLDGNGRVTGTWLNTPTALGLCFEKELQAATFPTDGRPEFYTFIGFSF